MRLFKVDAWSLFAAMMGGIGVTLAAPPVQRFHSKKKKSRVRIGGGTYGKSLMAHFNARGVEGIHFSRKSRIARQRAAS